MNGIACTARSMFFACFFALPTLAMANDDVSIATARVTTSPDGSWAYTSNGSMSGDELGQMIEQEIGKDNYQNVTVYLGTCHSGAGVDNVQNGLSGSNRVIAECSANQSSGASQTGQGPIEGFEPGFFEALEKDPNLSVEELVEAGKQNEPYYPKSAAEEAELKARYEQRIAYVKTLNETRRKEGKTPLPVPPPWDSGGRDEYLREPQVAQSADEPMKEKLASGKSSNHAIIYQTTDKGLRKELLEKKKKALQNAGYTSVDVLTPLTKSDYDQLDKAAKENTSPNLREDAATPENLRAKLRDLKDKMNKEEGLTVIVGSHGSRVVTSERTDLGTGFGGGATITPFDSMDSIYAPMLATWFAEEALYDDGSFLLDLECNERWRQPMLLMQTYEENAATAAPTIVSLNGVSIGEIYLGLAKPGVLPGFHELSISDDKITQILDTTDFTNGFVLDFDFGSQDDFLKLATKEDLANSASDFGFGVAGIAMSFGIESHYSVVPVPAAGTFFPIALGAFAFVAIKKRRQKA